jgi:antitoxin PrlF
MATSKLTRKGQITVPKEVRGRLGLRPGDELEFFEEKGVFQVRKRVKEDPFGRWRGYLKHLEGRNPDEIIREMRGP